MSLNLINGLFYSSHKLEGIDNERLINETIRIRKEGNTYLSNTSRPHHTEVDVSHTFYEDVPLPEEIEQQFKTSALNAIDGVFGKGSFELHEVWGHYIPPLEQTMVHDHAGANNIQLSCVYYPHVPENAGNLFLICEANGQRHTHELECKAGYLYLFSSDLLHYTPRNGSGVDRVSVSANWQASPQFKDLIEHDVEYLNPYWYFVGRNDVILHKNNG
tara:strand:+ start:138 stop:788 length:651 start_codon:yes stop_codon:yes gene_type:complete